MKATSQAILPQSLPDQIAEWLVTEISEERLQPEQRLTEQYVAEQCQVSRGPVRDAFRIVEKLGLIRLLPRRGAVVCPLDINELKELFEIRAALVHVMTGHLIKNASNQGLKDLHDQARFLQSLIHDESAFFKASNDLSRSFTDLAHSHRIRDMLVPIEVQISRYRHHGFSSRTAREASARGFVMVIDAMLTRDRDKVSRAVNEATEKLLAEVEKAFNQTS